MDPLWDTLVPLRGEDTSDTNRINEVAAESAAGPQYGTALTHDEYGVVGYLNNEHADAVANALNAIGACTGYIDQDTGRIAHDGDTCPLHEEAQDG